MSKVVRKSLYVVDLEQHVRGEVLSDSLSLGLYATDASLYQITPLAVVLPRDETDVATVLTIARDHGIPVLPRGGGTSLAGQTVGEAIVMDFSKYMNRIIDFDAKNRMVRVEPGLVRDTLNKFLAPHGLIFSPDPATSSRANIGGMVGNNSSGTKSILFGKTVDHVVGMKVMLADGTVMEFKDEDSDTFGKKVTPGDRKSEIYEGLRRIIDNNYDEIAARFPKVMRRVSGYNLDEFRRGQPWNVSKLVCGSEGTLAVILAVDLHLDPLPKKKSVCAAHFGTLLESLKAVQITVGHNPSAVEILDHELLTLARKNLFTRKIMDFVEGEPNNILIIEFYGDTIEDIRKRQTAMIRELRESGFGYAFPVFDEGPVFDNVWALRKKGLGILLGRKTKKKPIAFIEDSAVPVEVLPEYITEVKAICDKYETQAAMYAHASVGVIHVRPIMDMTDPEDISKMRKISRETFELVRKYGGSWSGEHGDGLVRSYLLPEFFGHQIYQALRDVKSLFDPQNLMNPGKIIDAQDIAENLRYGKGYLDKPMSEQFRYGENGGFHETVHLCSGVGECRKLTGTMCPSYHATLDEIHSTRGRANALRLAMSGQLDTTSLTDHEVLEALDLCLSCKACKSECPSNVDMAKLKSEVLQMKYDKKGISLRERFIAMSSNMSSMLSGHTATLINGIIKSSSGRWMMDRVLGIDKRRTLPLYARKNLKSELRNIEIQEGRDVVLFADTYLSHHDVGIGVRAFELLSGLGFKVTVFHSGCCQRPLISNGFLKKAKKKGTQTAEGLRSFMERGIPVVVCEPSCASALNDDLADLIEDQSLSALLKSQVFPIEQFLADQLNGQKLPLAVKSTLVHGHCHQKALYGTEDLLTILGGAEVSEIDSGCCGMAGAFGYEKEHYDISETIGSQRLFPAIRAHPESEIVACGFSCRHQIDHFTGRKSKHWLELIDWEKARDLKVV